MIMLIYKDKIQKITTKVFLKEAKKRIKWAKSQGHFSTYILADGCLPPKEALKEILNKGYTIYFSDYGWNNIFIKVSWNDNGQDSKVFIGDKFGLNVSPTTLDNFYTKYESHFSI